MKFVIETDWDMQIRASVLAAVKNSQAALEDSIDTAISEMGSYLRGKYLVSKIFAPIYTWDPLLTYPQDTRIVFTVSTAFFALTDYAEGDLVVYNSIIYQANQEHEAGAWNAAHFTALCPNNSLFYVIAANSTAGFLPVEEDEFTPGDTRDPLILTYCKDIALYHIHSNISPNNIPQLRKDRYDQAIKWLDRVSKDMLTLDLPLADETIPSNTSRFGGNTKYSDRW